jgi:hypothetical protein
MLSAVAVADLVGLTAAKHSARDAAKSVTPDLYSMLYAEALVVSAISSKNQVWSRHTGAGARYAGVPPSRGREDEKAG